MSTSPWVAATWSRVCPCLLLVLDLALNIQDYWHWHLTHDMTWHYMTWHYSPGIQQSDRALPSPALHADHQGGVLSDVLHLEEVPEPGLAQLVLDTLQQQLGDTRAAQSTGLTMRVCFSIETISLNLLYLWIKSKMFVNIFRFYWQQTEVLWTCGDVVSEFSQRRSKD